MNPPVSVIAVCFNHERFVKEALESVVHQTYREIELIVVDDASTDRSVDIIRAFIAEHPGVVFIQQPANKGNCAAFNAGLARAHGEFIIDLATDDVLLPERIEAGVRAFQQKDESWGVQFSDAVLIDESGKATGYHSDRFPHDTVPEGYIFRELVARYFICSPTMMVRSTVMKQLNGYDESLAYEDFDFWIRSSRDFRYFYTPTALLKRRKVKGSLSDRQFKHGSPQQDSTFVVCEKIMKLIRTKDEQVALQQRIGYEMRQAISRGDLGLAMRYAALRKRLGQSE